MTISIGIGVSEGIVLSADSRMTYRNNRDDVRVASDYAQKLFQLSPRIGAVTYGWAFLMGRNINSHIEEFKLTLGDAALTTEEMTKKLGEYLQPIYLQHVEQKYSDPVPDGNYAVAFVVGGYDANDKTGRMFEMYVPQGDYYLIREVNKSPGSSWRGVTTPISRLLKGWDSSLQNMEGFPADFGKKLESGPAEYLVDYTSMTLQDGVDFAVFLTRLTIDTLRFSDGTRANPGASLSCGGPIDVAVIEPNTGFRWVQRKKLLGERQSLSTAE